MGRSGGRHHAGAECAAQAAHGRLEVVAHPQRESRPRHRASISMLRDPALDRFEWRFVDRLPCNEVPHEEARTYDGSSGQIDTNKGNPQLTMRPSLSIVP